MLGKQGFDGRVVRVLACECDLVGSSPGRRAENSGGSGKPLTPQIRVKLCNVQTLEAVSRSYIKQLNLKFEETPN